MVFTLISELDKFERSVEVQIGLYVRLHNLFVYLFIYVLLKHVSVVYDHLQAVFTCTLTTVFLLFLH
jgi:hypothetical protein